MNNTDDNFITVQDAYKHPTGWYLMKLGRKYYPVIRIEQTNLTQDYAVYLNFHERVIVNDVKGDEPLMRVPESVYRRFEA